MFTVKGFKPSRKCFFNFRLWQLNLIILQVHFSLASSFGTVLVLIYTCEASYVMKIWIQTWTKHVLSWLQWTTSEKKTSVCLRWRKRYLNCLIKVHYISSKVSQKQVSQGSIKSHRNLYPHLLNPMTLSSRAVTHQNSKHQPTTKIHKKTLLRPCGRYEKTSMRLAENWKGTS